ncbi:MAG: Unknown protein [uncultured Sulfurovum sp.]|uniref:Radical SAM core domain-containing protein n=1 Tax=uncultured Sulfurovum sp. TaxID=269237 RepID=A0A6S6S3J7_9BACT|nr:MAG: Unknown protein [uncultured Sulfurovum sp.]
MNKTGFLPAKVIHLHPTNLCNLNCLHCYSSSSPKKKDEVKIEFINEILKNLQEDGYEILSISGGEPLVYPKINELINFSKKIGLKVNLITNGMLLNRVIDISSKVSMFAISIDGSEENHDVMRNKTGAFIKLEENIRILSSLKISFGLAFCVTKKNIKDLMYVYDFATKYNAKLLQLHPLASIGRGEEVNESALSPKELERLYLTAKLLEEASLEGGVKVQIDLLPKNSIPHSRLTHNQLSSSDPISHQINPIVITENGKIIPFAYGVSDKFKLGNIEQPWKDIENNYRENNFYKIKSLVQDNFDQCQKSEEKIHDWYQSLVKCSV